MRQVPMMGLSSLAAVAFLLVFVMADAQRPRFHLRPPTNWINDPNGPYRDPITKKMHLYMQYNPNDSVWGDINWYHFISTDYVKWEDQGIALTNGEVYDNFGSFTGSITHSADGTPVLMYTCTSDNNEQRQCIAVPSKDDIHGRDAPRKLNEFFKLKSNPVLTEFDVPNLVGLDNFRDPTNFWVNPDNASEWLVAFAVRMNETKYGDRGHIVVFSTDDITWQSGFKYSHSIWHEDFDYRHMMECPEFFKLGSEHFLKVSSMISQHDFFVYGDYTKKNSDGRTIYEEDKDRTPTYVDYGRWYASKQSYDPILGRTILWGWIMEELSDDMMREQGWSGMMDIPRDMKYDTKAKKLRTFPMPELENLRLSPIVDKMELMFENATSIVTMRSGCYYELVVDFTLPADAMAAGEYAGEAEPSFGVNVLVSSDKKQYTRIAVTVPSTVGAEKDQTGRIYNIVSASSVKACKNTCEAERRCVAWTAVQDMEPRCALMSTFGYVVSANNTAMTGRTSDSVILLDRTHSGTIGMTEEWVGRAPLHHGNKVQLRVFVDGTAVQVFKDGGLESITGRVYNEKANLNGVTIFASNIAGPVTAIVSLYPMDSAYAVAEPKYSSDASYVSSESSKMDSSDVLSSDCDSNSDSIDLSSSTIKSDEASSSDELKSSNFTENVTDKKDASYLPESCGVLLIVLNVIIHIVLPALT